MIEFASVRGQILLRSTWLIGAVAVFAANAQSPAGGCDFETALRRHQSGDLAGAVEGYKRCVASQPNSIESRSNLGAVLSQMGRYEEAVDQYKVALQVAAPDLAPTLRLNLALAYYKSLQIPAAAVELETLHEADPHNLRIALLLADCHLRLGEFQKAVDVAAPLEKEHPDDRGLSYVLGMALIRSDRISEGGVRMDRLLRGADSAEGHLLLGSTLFSTGDYPGAVRELNRAAALNPRFPSVQSYLGQALLFTGDADGAAEAFRKELAANPNDFDANFHLAAILARRGQAEESRALLEHAVQVRPGSREAAAALAEGFHFQQAAGEKTGVALGTPAPPVGSLSFESLKRPVVLVFGSYSCPKLRSSAADLRKIAAEYHDRVDFRLVYISEAHPRNGPESQWQSTINQREGIDLAEARTLLEKQEHAALCVRKLDLPFAVAVDGMDAAAERAYQAWPSRLYLVGRDGRVAYETRLGELDFHGDDLERAIREMLGKS